MQQGTVAARPPTVRPSHHAGASAFVGLQRNGGVPPSPEELPAMLSAVAGRGAPLQSLTLGFERTADRRRTEAELLAVLDACSACHVSRLELRGAVPHSRATAEAVQACCPYLTSLDMTHMDAPGEDRRSEAVPSREVDAGYHDGCAQLLTLCGPWLTELRLHGVHHWQPLSYMAVRHCTALTLLEFEAKYMDNRSDDDLVEKQGGLSLADCSFPLAALPGMRFPMLHLTHLVLDLKACGPVDDQVLEPLLVLLCRPHDGAAPLKYLACTHVPEGVDGAECRRAALEQLEVAFGVKSVTMWVTPHSECPGSCLV